MRLAVAGLAAVALLLSAAPASDVATAGSTLDRPADPVVLTGANVLSLSGIPPGQLVAFRYTTAWEQLPVQVDERAMVDLGTVYNEAPNGVVQLNYTDANTWTGPDPDATLDANDEIAFMAKDAGGQPPSFSDPSGVVAGSGVEVAIADPLAAGQSGYFYLYRSTTLSPGAGQQYVNYGFNLLSGNYKTTYQLQNGPNPEDSSTTTAYYSHHFSDRWISDQMKIFAGAANEDDILDRHKALFAPGVCQRSEDTFSDAEGAFVINKSGPVRALRSYIGANSGPLTQREHVFYERRQDVRTFLRVHAISSVMDFFDYSPAASGMTYYNSLNTGGVTIDGIDANPTPDNVATGAITWEAVNGPEGGLAIGYTFSTNISPFTYTSYYLDDTTPPVTQCTGDAFAYGSSGPYINQPIPCTDPRGGASCTSYLNTVRSLYYEAPGLTTTVAAQRTAQTNAPLTFTTSLWQNTDSDGDGVDDVGDNCPTVANPSPQADGDGDALGDACEATPYGTNPADADTDDDGCADGREVRLAMYAPSQGGDRDPLSPHDFFDVPAPAGPATGADGKLILTASSSKNRAVTLADVSTILAYVGRTSANPVYTQDNSADGAPDGQQLDRAPSTTTGKPWRSAAPTGAVTLQDVSVALVQVGHSCVPPP